MPTYFVVKAFLLDKTNAPVCDSYESKHYTKAFEDFLAMSVDDYDAERVINLDDSNETNYAVVTDEAKVLSQTDSSNILATNDHAAGFYVFENADESVTSLQAGDFIYYACDSETKDHILIKVDSVSIANDTVTVTADKSASTSDFFRHIEIESGNTASVPEPYGISPLSDPAATYIEGDPDPISLPIPEKTWEFSASTITIGGNILLDLAYRFYYDPVLFGADNFEFYMEGDVTFTGDAEIDISIIDQEEPKELPVVDETVPTAIPFVCVTLGMKIDFEVSAHQTLNGQLIIKSHLGARIQSGQAPVNLCQIPTVALNVTPETSASLKITPSLSIGLGVGTPKVSDKLVIYLASLHFPLPMTISGTIDYGEIHISGDPNYLPDKIHECPLCLNGEIIEQFTVGCKIDFFGEDGVAITEKIALGDDPFTVWESEINRKTFHITVNKNSDGALEATFQSGYCPKMLFRHSFTVVDKFENPLANAQFTEDDQVFTTDENGQFTNYFGNGEHYLLYKKDIYENDTIGANNTYYHFTVNRSTGDHIVNANSISYYNFSGVHLQGTFSDTASWILYQDGTLHIRGTGAVSGSYMGSRWQQDMPRAVIIDDGITELGYNLFRNNVYLNTMFCTDSVTHIGEYAFSGTAFESFDIPPKVTVVDTGTFYNCTRLKTVTFPDGITRIYSNAFAKCASLESVTFPDSLTLIDADAFIHCYGLECVNLPPDLETVFGSSFNYCTSLHTYAIKEGTSDYYVVDGVLYHFSTLVSYPPNKAGNVFSVPDNITDIGPYAFQSNQHLTKILLHDQVATINNFAFSYCQSLTTPVTLPSSVQEIPMGLYEGTTSLTSITIPDNIRTIRDSAFENCTSLTACDLPEGLTAIGQGAFNNCEKLVDIAIPSGVTTLERDAFRQTAIETITIPDTLDSISSFLFNHCKNLKTVYLPAGITTIYGYAFSDCPALETVYFAGTTEQWKAIDLTNYNDGLATKIVCSDGMIDNTNVALSVSTSTSTSSAVIQKNYTCSSLKNQADCILFVVKDPYGSLTAPENLLYIDQQFSTLSYYTFTYFLPSDVTDYRVLARSAHVHQAGATTTVEPTCCTLGYTMYTCQNSLCGETVASDFVSFTEHTSEWITRKASSLEEEGLQELVCSECLSTLEVRVTPIRIMGDFNGDGILNMIDAFSMYSHISKGTFPQDQAEYVDMNYNGSVNMTDVFMIYKHAAGH